KPYVEQARDNASEFVENVRNDYLPRAQRALHAAAEAAKGEGTVAERGQKIARVASREIQTPEPVKKSRGKGRVFGTIALVGGLGVAVYYLWKRSQPTEDPWAEAYWEDVDGVKAPAEDAKDSVQAGADEVAETAEDVVNDAASAAGDVADKAKRAGSRAEDAIKEGAHEAKDAAEDVADKAKEAAQHAADQAKDIVEDIAEK
ncbi:hypothetical protein QP814_06795, partial [Actinotignum timonense]|nr:hypothetical protein [Actinotignum timonense]